MSIASLTRAAHDTDHAGVAALLAQGSNPDETDAQGWTPLLYGVLTGDAAIVGALIRAGADVNRAAPDGATPLIKAVLWRHAVIVRALLDAGADPEQRDRTGWNALDLADAAHDTEISRLLGTHHLNPKTFDRKERS